MAVDMDREIASAERVSVGASATDEKQRALLAEAFCETLLAGNQSLSIFEFAQLVALWAKAQT